VALIETNGAPFLSIALNGVAIVGVAINGAGCDRVSALSAMGDVIRLGCGSFR
jgi:hypothetical protein